MKRRFAYLPGFRRLSSCWKCREANFVGMLPLGSIVIFTEEFVTSLAGTDFDLAIER